MTVTINGTTGITTPAVDANPGDVAAQTLSVDGNSVSNVNGNWRNRIINGDMRIDQRNAGASVTPTSSGYIIDRWRASVSVASKFSAAKSNTSVAGFTNSLLMTSLSAYTIGASEQLSMAQRIEGLNIADLAWGTASAQTVTLSFWTRSSLTGTFGGAIQNSAGNRSYPFTFTINSANTFEYKTITIPGDTTGTWLTDENIGMILYFNIGTGSTLSGTAGAWSSSNYVSATGATSVVGTNGATFYITGVQLEAGSAATPFERRPYGTELQLCERYFYRSGGSFAYQSHALGTFTSTQTVDAPFIFPVPFRTSPSLTVNNLASFVTTIGGVPNSIVLQDAPSTNNNQLMLRIQVPTASTIGYSARLYSNNNAAATLDFSAEL